MRFVINVSCLFVMSTSCFAQELDAVTTENILSNENDPYFNVTIGISPFTGVLGFEAQKKNHSVSIGLPDRISYRYYSNPYQDTKFWGLYLGGYSLSESDTNKKYSLNGVNYSDVERSYIGVGAGYRWQWPSGWNVSASIAIEYFDEKYSDATSTLSDTDSGLFPFPGINVGFKF